MMKTWITLIIMAVGMAGCLSAPPASKEQAKENNGVWPEDTKGTLFIVGGGERTEELMKQYIKLGGGEKARVLVVPFASGYIDETGQGQCKEMMVAGADTAYYISCAKEDIDKPENLAMLDDVTAVFFSGGDQNRLTDYLRGTRFFECIVEIYRNGGVLGGTSAGAAVMSRVMLTGKEQYCDNEEHAFETIMCNNVKTAEGFGFIRSAIIDQHFFIRKRQNRLLSVVMDHPELKGIGIDESTAIIVYPDGVFEVAGESGVVVYQIPKDGKVTKMDTLGRPSMEKINLSLLIAGDSCTLYRERL